MAAKWIKHKKTIGSGEGGKKSNSYLHRIHSISKDQYTFDRLHRKSTLFVYRHRQAFWMIFTFVRFPRIYGNNETREREKKIEKKKNEKNVRPIVNKCGGEIECIFYCVCVCCFSVFFSTLLSYRLLFTLNKTKNKIHLQHLNAHFIAKYVQMNLKQERKKSVFEWWWTQLEHTCSGVNWWKQ